MCAMDSAQQQGVQYADIRIIEQTSQRIVVQSGIVDTVTTDESMGFGVRALVNGRWGFAASSTLSSAEIDRVMDQAVRIARASALLSLAMPVELGPAVTSRGVYTTPIQIDPFSISIDDKIALLMATDAIMSRVNGATVRKSNLTAFRERRCFANSEGAITEQTIYEVGGGIAVTAVGHGEVQIRSYPNSMGGQGVTGGWEMVQAWDLPGNAERVATEAVQLLTAAPCPTNIHTTVILGGPQVALQVHESCGHAVELDRVFGAEAGYAGTSFLTPEKLHTFRYGSDYVNITADAVRPLGLGTCGWDDEGVSAQQTPIVKEGILVGYLMSRETAAQLGHVSNGCMRASNWSRLPLVRMGNVSLEPGSWTLSDLIADTEEGIYMDLNRSWSIDDRRYNFQFGTEIGYEIKHGKLGRMLRNCTYTGITSTFWNSCDAVCNADAWSMLSTLLCGKGQPSQIIRTSHGAAPARFRNVRVGVL